MITINIDDDLSTIKDTEGNTLVFETSFILNLYVDSVLTIFDDTLAEFKSALLNKRD